MTTVVSRQRWVVDTMAIGQNDRVLEVGCGRGTVAAMISQQLASGRITAIDRSATMARLTRERLAGFIEAGTADVRRDAIETVDLPAASFDKIFAVNLSLFWIGDISAGIERVKQLLTPEGRLYVFGERPSAAEATAIGQNAEALLQAHGFTTVRASATGRGGRGRVCVSASTSNAVLDRTIRR
ncbi:class I SAM-dependent methyltransferase [Micromonospora sp. CPCC 205539]|uniref:class I SAM-dependent methyltransferase n=1 Tax=Micromonospora sp. CPCC 205539 TaxID=3122408 RepID=UPI002FEF96B3